MGESSTTTDSQGQTQQNREPWGPSQRHLDTIMEAGRSYYGQGVGSRTWQGDTVAPLNQRLEGPLRGMYDTAVNTAQSAMQPYTFANQQMGAGGISDAMQPGLDVYRNAAGGGTAINERFGSIFSSAAGQPTFASANLQDMAQGGGTNPYLQAMLDRQRADITNSVNSSMSASGRYGPNAGHTGLLVDRIAQAQNPLLAQAYESDQNRMLQANAQMDQARMQQLQTMMGAEQGRVGVQQQSIANELQGAAGLLGNLQQGAQREMSYAAMAPQLYQGAFQPYERAAAVGDYLQGRDQQALQGQRERFEQQEAMPWTQLARYGAALGYISPFAGNAGSISGTTSGTQTQSRPYGFMDYANLFQGGSNSAASGIASALALPMMLSDRRAKTDIQKLGESETTGLPIYAYRYKGDKKDTPKVVGPMAQDIESRYPGSTAEIGGMMVVKPPHAGLLGAL